VKLALLALMLASPGCVTVRPWQRERLARRCMEMDAPAGMASFEAHVRAVRSGDVAAAGAGGGGCGCN
jgi:hypothetical protein